MRERATGYRSAALFLLLVFLLAGCAVADTGREIVADAQQQVQQQLATATPRPPAMPTESPGSAEGGVAARLQTVPTVVPQDVSALSEYERIVNQVYARNIDAVVNLSDNMGTGSGFIIDREGHIVTNNHVVEGMRNIGITFADGSLAQAELIGTFPEGDIAVVRADRIPEAVEPVELGDSSQVTVGQITVAIGSPLGLQQTVTSGIVSAINRSIEDLGSYDPESSLQGLIQTDASINPGNSGGPLFDSRGRVIGMNTLIASRSQGNIGLGFAVPVNRIKRVIRQLIDQGRYQRPLMGVSIQRIVPELAQELNFPTTQGVMVVDVVRGGPAEQAGLRGATEGVRLGDGQQYATNGDIIIEVNGLAVRTFGDLRNILETEADVGDTVTVTFLREGREQQTEITLTGD